MPAPEQFTVTPADEGKRLDLFLAAALPAYSRARLQNLLAQGTTQVNEQLVDRSNYRLKTGDRITFQPLTENPLFPEPEPFQLPILFEDDYLLALDKPPGIATHPNGFTEHHTVVQALLGYYPPITEALYDPENPVSRLRPGIVHRLDKDTSGVLLVAKTEASLLALAQLFQERKVEKTYVSLLVGNVSETTSARWPLQRLPGNPNRMGIAKPGEGRPAVTHFSPEETFTLSNGTVLTLVTCQPETGRTHQIRVHAAALGYPVLGDRAYSTPASRALAEQIGTPHHLLHAHRLNLRHPFTGEQLTLTAPVPKTFIF